MCPAADTVHQIRRGETEPQVIFRVKPGLSPPYTESLRLSKHTYTLFLVETSAPSSIPLSPVNCCVSFLSVLLPKDHSTGGRDKERAERKRTYIFQGNQFHRRLIGRSQSRWVVVVNNVMFIIGFVGDLTHKEKDNEKEISPHFLWTLFKCQGNSF